MGKPRKPKDIIEPKKYKNKTVRILFIDNDYGNDINVSIKHVKDKVKAWCLDNGIDYSLINEDEIIINFEGDNEYCYYDDVCVITKAYLTFDYRIDNPKYDVELAKYQKDKESYDIIMKRYEIRLKNYISEGI